MNYYKNGQIQQIINNKCDTNYSSNLEGMDVIMAVIIDGKAIAKKTREYLKKEVEELKENGINPKLSVIMVGDNAASKVYIKNKSKACDEVGVK